MTPEHRTLLTRAAKAAGYDITWKEGYCKGGEYAGAFIGDKPWNPLEDDGDRYRLARVLQIVIDFDGMEARFYVRGESAPRAFRWGQRFLVGEAADTEALAITRAAASMAGE